MCGRFSLVPRSDSFVGMSNSPPDGASQARRMSVVEIHDKNFSNYSHYNNFIGTSQGQVSSGTHTYSSESTTGQSRSYSEMRVTSFGTSNKVTSSTDVLILRANLFTPSVLKAKSENVVVTEFLNATLQLMYGRNVATNNVQTLIWLIYRRSVICWITFISLTLFAHMAIFLLSEVRDGLICLRAFFGKNCVVNGKSGTPNLTVKGCSCGFCKKDQNLLKQ